MSEIKSVFKDKAGKVLKPGDLVLYGHALGRCAGIRYGKVTGIQWGKSGYGDRKLKLKVRGVDDDWRHREANLTQKEALLEFPSRIVKIEDHQIPEKYKALLDKVEISKEESETKS